MAVEAIGANMTLESLDIRALQYPNQSMVEPLLLRLGAHPCLRELIMRCPDEPPSRRDHIDALTYFLRASRTLEHISLGSFRFSNRLSKDILEPIVEAVQWNKSLTKLTIDDCEFDLESTILLHDILKPKNGKITIRELHLTGMSNNHFQQRAIGTVVTSILSPKHVDDDNGSKKDEIIKLDVLSMDEGLDGNLQSVFEILGNKATSIQLRCFRYTSGWLDLAGCEALAVCLPKLIYLEEVTIHNGVDRALAGSPLFNDRLLRALKQNGSLQDVQISLRDQFFGLLGLRSTSLFTGNDLRRVQLYCKRNRRIPSMVVNARLDDDHENGDDRTERCLFPKLFGAAKQAPRTAPTLILMGLLCSATQWGTRMGVTCRRSDLALLVSVK
jgi:hypothetical protein